MNAIYVSLDYFSEDKSRSTFCCGNFNWIGGTAPADISASSTTCSQEPQECGPGTPEEEAQPSSLYVKIRHGPYMYECKAFQLSSDGASAHVELFENDQGLAPGQYAVFYQDEVCLGCSVIQGDVFDSKA